MKHLALVLAVGALLLACSDQAFVEPSVEEMGVEEFNHAYFWDLPSAEWVSSPMLVIAKKGGIYPEAPDAQFVLECQTDGTLVVWGDAYHFVTDVGGPPDLLPLFGVRSPGVSLLGEPIWQYGGYAKSAHYILHPTGNQRAQLVSGDWFEIANVFADGSGTVRYPPPPLEMAREFNRRCEAVIRAR
jgi:hypothetical protein